MIDNENIINRFHLEGFMQGHPFYFFPPLDNKYGIKTFPLKFKDEIIEKEFRQFIVGKNYHRTQLALILGVIIVSLFASQLFFQRIKIVAPGGFQ